MDFFEKKGSCLLFVIGVFIFFFGLVDAGQNSENDAVFEANVLAPAIKIEFPDYVFFGNVTSGFESGRIRININNTGTTAIEVTPKLSIDSNGVFENLYFTRRTTEPYKRIGDFSLVVDKPTSSGGKKSEYFYAKLDLTNYNKNLDSNLMNQRGKVVFWVMPK